MESSSASVGPSSRRGMMSNVRLERKDTKGETSISLIPGTQRADGSWRKDVKVKEGYNSPEDQQKYVLNKLFKEEEKPVDSAISFFRRHVAPEKTSISLFSCRDNYDYDFVADADKIGKSKASKEEKSTAKPAPIPPNTTPTPSKDIKIVANGDFKQKQSVTAVPNPEEQRKNQVPVEDLRKDQVQEMPTDADPDPEQEELTRLWESLKDDEERILMWNNHVNSWCWRKYVCK